MNLSGDNELKKFLSREEWDYLSDPSRRYVDLTDQWRETLIERRNTYHKDLFYHTYWAWRDI